MNNLAFVCRFLSSTFAIAKICRLFLPTLIEPLNLLRNSIPECLGLISVRAISLLLSIRVKAIRFIIGSMATFTSWIQSKPFRAGKAKALLSNVSGHQGRRQECVQGCHSPTHSGLDRHSSPLLSHDNPDCHGIGDWWDFWVLDRYAKQLHIVEAWKLRTCLTAQQS